MTENHSIELEVEVPGSAEEVWRAVATGGGISSWYVPHTVEEREGGAATARFGPGPDMEVPGRVASWDPPRRIVFDGGEDAGGMSFEWTVEERGTTCVVRLVNDGFGHGEDWESQYEAMTAGWKMFLTNLAMHLEHFAGRSATASVPSAMWDASRDDAWRALTAELALPAQPAVGEAVSVRAHDAPTLAGTVVETTPWRMSLLLHEPAPGTALIAAEGMGDQVSVSVWTYLYGPEGSDAATRDEPRWQVWLERHAPRNPTPSPGPDSTDSFTPPDTAEALARLGMPLEEAMVTQRAVRRLHLDPVDDELLLSLLELSLKAPTSSNTQDWSYVVVSGSAQKAKLARQYRILYRIFNPITERLAAGDDKALRQIRPGQWQAENFEDLPVFVVPCYRRNLKHRPVGRPQISVSSFYGSVYPAVQNLLLACRAVGLGASLQTLPLWFVPATRRTLGLPRHMVPVCIIPIGWAKGRYGPTTRAPIGEVVHVDHFGNRPYLQR